MLRASPHDPHLRDITMNLKSSLALAAALCLGATVAVAQTAPAKPAAKKAAKPTKVAKAAPAEAEPGPATPEQLAAAERVYYGTYECEMGKTAQVTTLPKFPGYAEVKSGTSTWLMKPVASSTGAIRLEDLKGRFLVIQIANKSMLFDSKSGQRVLDGCMNAEQKAVTASLAAKS